MSITDEFPEVNPLFYNSPNAQMMAYGYCKMRDRAIELEKALERIVEIFDTDGDVYHDIEAMVDVAEKALNQHNP